MNTLVDFEVSCKAIAIDAWQIANPSTILPAIFFLNANGTSLYVF